jgi:hypothetical protein
VKQLDNVVGYATPDGEGMFDAIEGRYPCGEHGYPISVNPKVSADNTASH